MTVPGVIPKQAFVEELKSLEHGFKTWALEVIPKQAFLEELKSLDHGFKTWALDFIDGLCKCESTALLLKGSGEEKALELIKHRKNLEQQYEQLQAGLVDQREVMLRYNEWIAHVEEKDVRLAERITQLLESKRRGEDKVSVAMADISSKLDYRKQKLDALRKATSWYKELLGIRCEYSNAVRFIFTNIDPNKPDREFSFSIHHDKIGNKFSMVDCNPHIAETGPLLDALNTSNELSQFVRSMRWEFVALSKEQSQNASAVMDSKTTHDFLSKHSKRLIDESKGVLRERQALGNLTNE